jgi:hypothetical protein
MSRWLTLTTAAVTSLLPFAGSALAADARPFEDVHVVQLPKAQFGYRGMPGTIVALNDGRLLLAYTRIWPSGSGDGSIAAKYSSDTGKTWGEEFVLVPDPAPAGRDYYCPRAFCACRTGRFCCRTFTVPAPRCRICSAATTSGVPRTTARRGATNSL